MSLDIINADTQIYVISSGVSPDPDLSLVAQIIFSYLDVNNNAHSVTIPSAAFLIQSEILITFRVPDHCNFTTQLITVNLDGTQFSGSVQLGPNSVIIANGSGIYKLTNGKSNDTIYVDSTIGSGTTDVAIPNPFVETGFIGG